MRWIRALTLITTIGFTGCAADFESIPQRCASAPDPAGCRQAAYNAYYADQRARMRLIGND